MVSEIVGVAHSNKLLALVSRSFAVCIPRLPKVVRQDVGNFYLLCRFADSIEDSKLSLQQKERYFKRFRMVLKKEDPIALKKLTNELLPFIWDKHDIQLVNQFEPVLKEFSGLNPKAKKIALKWLKEMVWGMNEYSQREIKTFLELNKYCYYVAGTVGFYLTDLFVYKFKLTGQQALKKSAEEFGLLLQKVNIIRDFSKDFSQGRVFWPRQLFEKYGIKVERVFEPQNEEKRKLILEEMVVDAKKHVQASVEYIKRLPAELKGLRTFCAIPLFMALPTLALCEGNPKVFEQNEKVKLSRTETIQIIHNINRHVQSDAFLEQNAH
ncbi:squalene/phytoene synthase family protein [Candidatus Micrarchaeota archaeon]|nr:squalene/phytoene synthase family protein [Candidatus Micrarchaeota archaeon]